jgi:hypothetical protein
VAQPDDRQQELVGHAEVEVVAAAESPLATGAVEAAAALAVKSVDEAREHGVEGIDGQAGHGLEDAGALGQVLTPQDHDRLGFTH